MRNVIYWLLVIFVTITFSGCTLVLQKGRSTDIEKIEVLSKQLDELEQARQMLEEALKNEIADKQVRLNRAKKGLVITFVADVLFDSGKAKIKSQAYPVLEKVAGILTKSVPANEIGIEGHTDNKPIKYSGWKSNWELSTARALSVLHYLIDDKGISPLRVSAIGYGEYRPVASNATKEGRQLNRRVEIVILPRITKVKGMAEEKAEEEVKAEVEAVEVEEIKGAAATAPETEAVESVEKIK
jgi:chemotaxis protein MotB